MHHGVLVSLRPAWAALLLLAGCGEHAVCEAPAQPRRVAATGAAKALTSAWSGDHAYYSVTRADGPPDTYVGPRCGDAERVAAGIVLTPARLHLDRRDDDPTLACDWGAGRFYRLDLTGREPPALDHSDQDCQTLATGHGALVHSRSHTLWLYPDFPHEEGAELLGERVTATTLVEDAVYYKLGPTTLARFDLATRERLTVAEDVYFGYVATPTHAAWPLYADEGPDTIHVKDVTTGELTTFAFMPPALEGYEHGAQGEWQFTPDGAHLVWDPTLALTPTLTRAFDLHGEEVAYPVPGYLLRILLDDTALSIAADGRYHATRIGGPAVALDATTELDPPSVPSNRLYRVTPLHPGRIHVLRDGALWAVQLDGSPAERLAEVDEVYHWIDARRLVALVDGELLRVDVMSGERRVLDRDVLAYSLPGDPAADGLHYLVDAGEDDPRTGVWFLPPGLLVAD